MLPEQHGHRLIRSATVQPQAQVRRRQLVHVQPITQQLRPGTGDPYRNAIALSILACLVKNAAYIVNKQARWPAQITPKTTMEHAMDSLRSLFTQVIADSGLQGLLQSLPTWLALDERQLIFVLATPVFIGVFVWNT
ncbi:hypothetical protein ULG90_21965 [Halopseudomonas pachastrellae]|nr:hypothetical protein ULG90_21965 [Halopseudomonas pachastrellae]